MKIGDILTEFKAKPPVGEEPEVLTLTERNGFVRQSDRFNKRLATEDVSSYKFIERDDFAFNPYLLWAGALARNDQFESGVISPLYPTFRVNPGFEPAYVIRILLADSSIKRYDGIAFGSVPRRRRSSVKDFLALDIPRLPSLNEQRRITDILDKADALRAKRREAIALLDALGQSIFNQMFIGDFRQTATLGEILKVSSGKFLPAKSMTEGGHYPVYGGNGITGFHDQYVVEEATLVIGRVGANCGAVHLTRPKSWITDNALRVKKLLPLVDEYLLFALRQADLNQYANVSGQPSISGASIYRVPVSVPAFELQQKFANRVAAVELLKTKHRLQLAELDNLFLSLQDRAFKGEL